MRQRLIFLPWPLARINISLIPNKCFLYFFIFGCFLYHRHIFLCTHSFFVWKNSLQIHNLSYCAGLATIPATWTLNRIHANTAQKQRLLRYLRQDSIELHYPYVKGYCMYSIEKLSQFPSQQEFMTQDQVDPAKMHNQKPVPSKICIYPKPKSVPPPYPSLVPPPPTPRMHHDAILPQTLPVPNIALSDHEALLSTNMLGKPLRISHCSSDNSSSCSQNIVLHWGFPIPPTLQQLME